MELWRQCAMWLIECRVLPESHRVTWDGAQVCDLAQALRDGVLLCQLLNNLIPQAVNLKEINLRPQMSQFLCLKNIRTFLGVCQDRFHLRKNDLFEAFELFDVRDFGKVRPPLRLSVYQKIKHKPFPLEGSAPDDEIYSGLSDQIDDTVDEDDDLYDFVEDEDNEGDEIYEDLMRIEEQPGPQKVEVDKRECCLQELRQTEEKYSDTLESILQHFMRPLEKFLQAQDIESIFINIKELASTHHSLLDEIRNSIFHHNAKNLYQVFVKYKERLLLYGHYCSQVEASTKHLDKLSMMKEDIRMKLEECSKRANSGRFSLRDLLMVPMQRVLKYPLLLQELLKHTTDPTDKENLRTALDAMRDLAQCINEVKRDNEIIKQITTFQMSIENLTQSLALFGRPKIDGELKICSLEKKSKQDRYAFLFDKAVIICKRKSGETFELKEIIELNHYQIRDEPSGEKDNKKWSYLFLLLDCYSKCGYDFFFKTRELKKKWLEQFEMAIGDTTEREGLMEIRGTFHGRCTRCKMVSHKECLGRVPACGRSSGLYKCVYLSSPACFVSLPGFPKMEVCQEYYGLPPPPVGFGQPLQLFKGDIIELTRADADLAWWEGRNLTTGLMGWFPCQKVQPYISVSTPSTTFYEAKFAGHMDRNAAKNLLMPRSNGTFLVRQKDAGEFAISLKFNMDIRHIRITSSEGLYRINEKKAFRSLVEMIEFYQKNSLKEYFRDVDTTLQTPYKQPEQRGSIRSLGVARARYDYSARDRTELSLQEGDTIRILSKKGHSGWWRGEVYGRVGLFPANYVEEDFSDYC
uniref:Osteoclast-stimulating factor 1 n=1 Tax=Kryptolebias marmoratus TaxID=37003 RepID=A0A3Q3A6C4_KRYMA